MQFVIFRNFSFCHFFFYLYVHYAENIAQLFLVSWVNLQFSSNLEDLYFQLFVNFCKFPGTPLTLWHILSFNIPSTLFSHSF